MGTKEDKAELARKSKPGFQSPLVSTPAAPVLLKFTVPNAPMLSGLPDAFSAPSTDNMPPVKSTFRPVNWINPPVPTSMLPGQVMLVADALNWPKLVTKYKLNPP